MHGFMQTSFYFGYMSYMSYCFFLVRNFDRRLMHAFVYVSVDRY